MTPVGVAESRSVHTSGEWPADVHLTLATASGCGAFVYLHSAEPGHTRR